jgi:hypothetical protein
MAYSLAGLGLAAWVLVSVNFALAVRKMNHLDANPRLEERIPPVSSGFIWPT